MANLLEPEDSDYGRGEIVVPKRSDSPIEIPQEIPSVPFDPPPCPPLIVNARSKWRQRVLIGTPMTGLVRSEWVAARYSQSIPTNWSQVEATQLMHSHIPLKFQVADAENVIARWCMEKEFQWLLFIEHDNVLPPGTFIRLNEYMIDEKVPIVGALYFTKSDPPEPLVYRRLGFGYYPDWKLGDKVWVAGLPFGCTLIHGSIIKALWDESPEYIVQSTSGAIVTRRIFQSPNEEWYDPEMGGYKQVAGTSDLQLCERIMKDRIFEKAGWPEYQKMEFPYLIDTNIFVKHIDERGWQYPLEIPKRYLPDPKPVPQVQNDKA